MVHNMVFDMGRVMLQFDPPFISSHFVPPEDTEEFAKKVFGSACWESLDRGTITLPQAREVMRRTLPERLLPNLDKALEEWFRYIPPVEGMEPLVRELKQAGYGIYLLTNANFQFHQYQDAVPAWDCFDGLLVSSDHQLLKPEPAIYLALTDKYRLEPPDCLFIDDRPENIAGAQAVGMEGILFTGPDDLRRELVRQGFLSK